MKSVSSASSQLTTRLGTKLIPSLLLPKDHSSYYRYHGSLTTPNCQESVIWTVLSNKLTISVSQVNISKLWLAFSSSWLNLLCKHVWWSIFFILLQLEVFRKLEIGVNETLAYNNRPIQSLGSRLVYHHLDGYSSAGSISPKTFLVFSSLLTLICWHGRTSPWSTVTGWLESKWPPCRWKIILKELKLAGNSVKLGLFFAGFL